MHLKSIVMKRVLLALLLCLPLSLARANGSPTFALPPDASNNLASISVTTSGLTGACPGDTGTVTFTITAGTNAQFNKQLISIYGELLTAADDNGCAGFTNTCQPSGNDVSPAWWVIQKTTQAQVNGTGTAVVDPCTDSCSCAVPNNWPNNGGWNSPPLAGVGQTLSYTGQTVTISFAVEIPVNALTNVTYMLELGVNFGNFQNQTGASEGYVCLPITVGGAPNCVVPSTVSLNKTLDSALVAGQNSIYFITYSFDGTGNNNYVQDTIPACLTVVDVSADPIDGTTAPVKSGASTYTWQVQNAAAGKTVTGELYVEVTDSTCAVGSQVCNTANASTTSATSGFTAAGSSACATAGSPNLTLTKAQFNAAGGGIPNTGATVANGSTIDYVLTYNFAGLQLECFDGFTSDTAGTSTTVNSTATFPGPAATGIGTGNAWIVPSYPPCGASSQSTWNIEKNPNPDSGNYLYYPVAANAGIPAGPEGSGYNTLLNTCPAMGVAASESACKPTSNLSFCGGTIITDVSLENSASNKEDIGIVLRSDSNPADPNFGDSYSVILSVDEFSTPSLLGAYATANNPAAQGVGHLYIQKWVSAGAFGTPGDLACNGVDCASGPPPTCPANANFGTVAQSAENTPPLTFNAWYTVKITEVPSAGCDCKTTACTDLIEAKYWPTGSPEPANWMVTFNDPNGFPCSGTWLPGVSGQDDVEGWDNYRVYADATLTNAALWDTVPAGVTYQSANPVQQGNATEVRWNFTNNLNGANNGLLYPGSGTFTWTGVVSCMSPITNTASMGATEVNPPVVSNLVSVNVSGCGTPTDTPTSTDTPTDTPTRTDTPTYTDTPTDTPTDTSTDTRTDTPTDTPSDTPTDTPTKTDTPTDTVTVTSTPTFTDTDTLTATPTRTDTPTDTSTFTDTDTLTDTPTRTDTLTDTPTYTYTLTDTPSYTDTDTLTDTPTYTDSPTVTDTSIYTPSDTSTFTKTSTDTQTSTDTDTPTGTPTNTDTPTDTPTFTDTDTLTATPSFTDTPTDTPTFTASDTRTATPTYTDTRTDTPTFTDTDTRTATPTSTDTPTVTQTYTATNTPVPVPNQVVINIYNSAGELVKSLFNGGAQYQPEGVGLNATVVEGGAGAGEDVFISFPGFLVLANGTQTKSITWTTDNDNGQLVVSGVYTVQVQISNNFGQVTTLTKAIQVLSVMPHNTLNIYNSSGEVVANVPLPVGVGTGIVSMSLATSYTPDYDPTTGKAQGLTITVTSAGGGSPTGVAWYGVNTQGQPVGNGIYTAELVYYAPGGTKTLIIKYFSVLSSKPAKFGGVFAVPNPAQHGAPIAIEYNSIPSSYVVNARLYNIAGQLVEEAQGQSAGPVVFPTNHLASGVYIASLEMSPGGPWAVVSRAVVKLAVIR